MNAAAPLAVSGWGAVSPAGVGRHALAGALAAGTGPRVPTAGRYPEPMPTAEVYACADFDARALLGRKGTSSFDRATALALVACGEAIAHSRLEPEGRSDRIGVALGTTVGSLQSSSDYSRETLVEERPYLVNPLLFPNTVMNCAAGQAAIWHRLKGVNGTVATGQVGFVGALRYAASALRHGRAEAMLAGAVEELTPHRAWVHHHSGRPGTPGEAAVVFVLQPAQAVARPLARVAATAAGYCLDSGPSAIADALAGCLARALRQAGVEPAQVAMLATADAAGGGDGVETAAAAAVFGARPVRRVRLGQVCGDCGAATGGLQLAALLALLPATADAIGVLTSWSPDGAVGAVVVERDVRADRG